MTDIQLQDFGDRGRYVYAMDGDEAELTFVRASDSEIVVDHTFVPPAWRGRGIAEKLVRHVVEEARIHGFKIRPVCPYVVVAFRRHPEWADIQA